VAKRLVQAGFKAQPIRSSAAFQPSCMKHCRRISKLTRVRKTRWNGCRQQHW